MKVLLLYLTRSLAAGLAMLWVAVRQLLPNLYLSNTAKSDLPLVYEGDYPRVYPQSYGQYLDRLGFMFDVPRIPGEEDDAYRVRILFVLRRNASKEGIQEALTVLFSSVMMEVDVEIHESFTEVFDGISTTLDAPMRSSKESLLYGVTIVIRPKVKPLSVVKVPNGTDTPTNTILPTGTVFHKVYNNHYLLLLDIFRVNSFTELMRGSVAAGVNINRVVILEPGAGGSRYRNI